MRPDNILTVVVFPEPFGPRRPNRVPKGISRFKLLTATIEPNALVNEAALIEVPFEFIMIHNENSESFVINLLWEKGP
jgi:hypothetical protein